MEVKRREGMKREGREGDEIRGGGLGMSKCAAVIVGKEDLEERKGAE